MYKGQKHEIRDPLWQCNLVVYLNSAWYRACCGHVCSWSVQCDADSSRTVFRKSFCTSVSHVATGKWGEELELWYCFPMTPQRITPIYQETWFCTLGRAFQKPLCSFLSQVWSQRNRTFRGRSHAVKQSWRQRHAFWSDPICIFPQMLKTMFENTTQCLTISKGFEALEFTDLWVRRWFFRASTAALRERDGSDASPEWMPLTSGESCIQTTLKTFQDLDLSSKAVIMDVVGYIGRQQLRNKQALWSWSDLTRSKWVLPFC